MATENTCLPKPGPEEEKLQMGELSTALREELRNFYGLHKPGHNVTGVIILSEVNPKGILDQVSSIIEAQNQVSPAHRLGFQPYTIDELD